MNDNTAVGVVEFFSKHAEKYEIRLEEFIERSVLDHKHRIEMPPALERIDKLLVKCKEKPNLALKREIKDAFLHEFNIGMLPIDPEYCEEFSYKDGYFQALEMVLFDETSEEEETY